ncbi:Brp/Blh family beta-carotene 15,15'-dioxygenase [Salinibacterium sp.]|uniref:Brp/Blh family beta-carotene 15,15'-dioxygenase n=1 Tax=Salinibacterium sp. TaxID=1915057 RepID=UPI00286B8D31|nr:Brp/Blh family beta-carotene 15,15'-dioxygenase [Salinibacterium sp.]
MTTVDTRRAPVETYLFVGVALLAIGVFASGIQASLQAQVIVLGVLAAVLGLPHGALDPLIARRLGLWRGAVGFAVFNLAYLGAVVVVVLLWLLNPIASLVAFLAVSAVHFGADWNGDRPAWLRITAGVGLLSLPALGHRVEVAGLYETLAPGGGEAISTVQFFFAPLALAGMLVGAVLAVRRRPNEAVELVVVALLAIVAPPLVFFVVYFCALHSVRHLRAGFRAETRGRLTVTIVVLYTVVPILAAVAFLLSGGPAMAMDDRLLQIIFIGLAGLTVPHMVLVALEVRRGAHGTVAP